MNRFSNYCILAITAWTCLCTTSEPLIAQTNYAEVCRFEMEAAKGNPVEFLMSKIKLTDALCEHDLNEALANGKTALEIGEAVGDSDAIVLSKLQIMTIRSLRESKSLTGFDESEFHLTDDATPEQRLLFFTSLIRFLICAQSQDARLDQYFESAREAERECRDPHLTMQLRSTELLYRLVWLAESPTSPQVVALRDRLQDGENRYPFLNNLMALKLLESAIANENKDRDQRIASLQEARSHATRLKNRMYIAQCNLILGSVYLRYKNIEKARTCFEELLIAARELGCEPLVLAAYRNLGTVHGKLGNSAKKNVYLKLAERSSAWNDQSPLNQNALFEQLLSVNRELKNESQVKFYEDKVWPLRAKLDYKQKERDAKEIEKNAALASQAAAKDLARLTEEHEADKVAAAALVARLWNFSVAATLGGSLFFAIFVWNRWRKVSVELDSEKDNVRHGQQELDALAVRLNRMQRMESLGLMAGSVAHDFNNILVGVLGNAEIIQMKKDLNDEKFVHERVASIITSAEKAASLSRQMLAYSGKQTIARYPTNLNRLILHYESVLESACSANQKLKLDLCDSKVVSKIDPTQIEQVILNLVTNAVEASSGKGRITITTGYETIVDIDSTLHGDRTTGGEFCFIEVKDSGKGILPQEIERIFEPFYSSSDAGRGLGLAVVYGVVKGHDGFIQCRSEAGKGTAFRVLLPISQEEAMRSELPREYLPVSEIDHSTNLASTQTVLVIDDEESVLDLCKQLLQISGWNVITAVDGKEGLAKAEQFADKISCVLLDVVMPEMGANELLNEFEKRHISIPTVIMSGFSQTKLEFFLERPNVVSIVQKPFHAMEIQQAVREAAILPDENLPQSVVSNTFSGFPQHAK